MVTLRFYKVHPSAPIPKFHTEESACFDFVAIYAGKSVYEGYDQYNSKITRSFHYENNDPRPYIYVNPGDRIMVPSGLIMDIPQGYSVRLHPRSGLSYKNGLVLANCEGVIDSDYFDEIMILTLNTSQNAQKIFQGDRVAQGELVRLSKYTIEETTERPVQRTSRKGGLGSTGVETKTAIETNTEIVVA